MLKNFHFLIIILILFGVGVLFIIVPTQKNVQKKLSRVLAKNGILYIMLYNKNSLYNWINVILRYGVLRGKLLKMSFQRFKKIDILMGNLIREHLYQSIIQEKKLEIVYFLI